MSIRRFVAALVLTLLITSPAAAQQLTPRPHLNWRTLSTEHFDVHYPAELEAWTRSTVSRLEAMHTAVTEMVGSAPASRVDVIVEDPANRTSGSAWIKAGRPLMYLWPTPPEPGSVIGRSRGFPELVALHEYVHIVHLTRPSRAPLSRLIFNIMPVKPLRIPRWAAEGYATYVEGRLTGSGRPHGVFRPSMLRQWALEGKLPSYDEMSDAGGFYQGQMAYLAGSAFLEWLVEQKGEASIVSLWRRMTARENRSFDDAFSGIYGGQPADLYDRFRVHLTERSLRVRERLAAAGLIEGETVQALEWYTGDPAISPDGTHVALALSSKSTPAKIVVWNTVEEADAKQATRKQRILERDPEDVAAIEWRPAPKKALATLHPVAGQPYTSPRFLPGGDALLVTRWVPLADGAMRPDLFVWNWETGSVRRVTTGASVRDADPSPDGRRAVAARCTGGQCDLVNVDLHSGAVSTIAEGSVDRVFYRPRWSPDGASIVASMQSDELWRVVVVPAGGGAPRPVGPADGAERYDASWTQRGELVAVSEAGGVANVVRLDLNGGDDQPLTRVTGMASAPEAHPDGSVFFLNLNAKGHALHRLLPGAPRTPATVTLSPDLYPAAPRAAAAPVAAFPRTELPADQQYRLGNQQVSWLPGVTLGGEGQGGTFALFAMDPVARLTTVLQGSYGSEGVWRGAGLSVAYRGLRPTVVADVFSAEQLVSSQGGVSRPDMDARYTGIAASLEQRWTVATGTRRLRAGVSTGKLETPTNEGDRQLGFLRAEWETHRGLGTGFLAAQASVDGAVGRTGGADWSRGMFELGFALGIEDRALRFDAAYGVAGDDAPAWEQFSVGGSAATLFNPGLLAQRLAMPGLPVGTLRSDRILTTRAALQMVALSPFFWAAQAGNRDSDWYRVLGIEASHALRANALRGLPGIHLAVGVVYPLDEPMQQELRGYMLIGIRP